ncbi:MAG TPA: sugar phosphate isomerase/epimerase [Streptosporangiaceae bacterium]|jgi:sugar phosphate isomerase/epimerase
MSEPAPAAATAGPGAVPPARIGVMMYTVLDQARADLEGTLAKLAATGYRGIETYGLVEHFGPARVRRAIADAGLELTSAHAPFPAGPRADQILDENAELGARVLVWSMEREEFGTPQAVLAGAERVNEAAERAAARGLTVAYHNHFAEFSQHFAGQQAYDLLLSALDDRVLVELDAYWAQLGGADAAEVLTRLGERARLVHVKDGPAVSYADDVMVPIGEGKIDWARVLTAPSGLRWHIVELERLRIDTFEALRRSYDYLVGSGLSAGRDTPGSS